MEWRMKLAGTRGMLSWAVFLALWYIPFVGNVFWGLIFLLARTAGVPLLIAIQGLNQFMFWK